MSYTKQILKHPKWKIIGRALIIVLDILLSFSIAIVCNDSKVMKSNENEMT